MRKRDMELDYLAPFLARIGDPKKLERQDAYKIKEECLQDLKQRLIDKANLIQARFEKVTYFNLLFQTFLIFDIKFYIHYCGLNFTTALLGVMLC